VKPTYNGTANDLIFFRFKQVSFNTRTCNFAFSGLHISTTVKAFRYSQVSVTPKFRLNSSHSSWNNPTWSYWRASNNAW